MNGSRGDGGRNISGMRLVDQRDRDDEDLVLFNELGKRQKDQIASLLQPVSEEFETNAAAGNYALYRIASKKKGSGHEFFGENGKNDYDWLKTPPATPLFPSLEMEAKVPELAVQREIRILHPLSRFSGNSVAATKESITASYQRKNNSSTENKNTKTTIKIGKQSLHTDFITSNISKEVGLTDTKTKARSIGVSSSLLSTIPAAQIYGFSNDLNTVTADHRSTSAARNRPAAGNSSLLTQIKQFSDDPIPPNLRSPPTNRSTSAARNRPAINPTSTPPSSRTITTNYRSTSAARNRPASSGISSGLSSQIHYLSNDPPPPPNLRTIPIDRRSTSATRNRLASAGISSGLSSQINLLSNDPPCNLRTTPTEHRSTSTTRGRSQNPSTDTTHKTQRKQSRSPSVTRVTKADQVKHQESSDGNGNGNGTERGIFPRGIVGSKMVEKVMNARKYSEAREITKSNNIVGRNLMSKSSLDLALKHTEMKRDHTNSHHHGTRGRSLTRSDHQIKF